MAVQAKRFTGGPRPLNGVALFGTTMHYLDTWLERKKASPTLGLKQTCSVTFTHKKHLGPRSQFAEVTLLLEPAAEFGFASKVVWPEPRNAAAYDESVLDGILDELFASRVSPFVARLAVTLTAIRWHEVDSSQAAFYFAARGAVQRGLYVECAYNVGDWQPGAE